MTQLADLTLRCQQMLQDEAETAWQPAQIRTALDTALMTLARRHLWQDFAWIQAVSGQSLYTLNDLATTRIVGIDAVLYDGVELRYASEERLDRLSPGWELQRTGPKWWSTDNTSTPTVVRIHPPPLVSGSTVPNFPADPLPQRWQENLVLVLAEHPQMTLDATEEVHVLACYEDAVVYEAVSRLAGFEGEWQALSLSGVMQALAQLIQQRLGAL